MNQRVLPPYIDLVYIPDRNLVLSDSLFGKPDKLHIVPISHIQIGSWYSLVMTDI